MDDDQDLEVRDGEALDFACKSLEDLLRVAGPGPGLERDLLQVEQVRRVGGLGDKFVDAVKSGVLGVLSQT